MAALHKQRASHTSEFRPEELEPRVLFSADLPAAAVGLIPPYLIAETRAIIDSDASLTWSVNEHAANRTELGRVNAVDPQREAQISILLSADPDLSYSAKTDKFYKANLTAQSWTDAEASAQASTLSGVTGLLATIDSDHENQLVRQLADTAGATDIWIGATDKNIEGDWRWQENGSEADQFWRGVNNGINTNGSYHNWFSGEPDASSANDDYAYISTTHACSDSTDSAVLSESVIEWNADDVLDATQPITYRISSQTVAEAFEIDANRGIVSLRDSSLLDADTTPTHIISIYAEDIDGQEYLLFTRTISLDSQTEDASAISDVSSGIEVNADEGNNSYLFADDGGAILGNASQFIEAGNLELNFGSLELSSTSIGSYTNANGQFPITFASGTTNAQANEIMQSIQYSNSSDTPPASVQINWSFSDQNLGVQGSGGMLTADGSINVSITGQPDIPTKAHDTTWLGSNAFIVNTETNNTQKDASPVALTDAGFVVTWISDEQDGDSYGVYFQRYDDEGNAVGIETQVNKTTANDQEEPAATVLTNGGFVITWQSRAQDSSDLGIFLRTFDADGIATSTDVAVNTSEFENQESPKTVSLTGGGFTVVWEDTNYDGDGHGVYFQRFNNSGVAQEVETQANTTTSIGQTDPNIQATLDGGFVIAWEDDSGGDEEIVVQRFDAAGVKLGGEIVVNTYLQGDQNDPDIAVLRYGGFVVVWESADQDGEGRGIYGQLYTSTGVASGSEYSINSTVADAQQDPLVAGLDDAGFMVVWESKGGQDGDDDGSYGQQFDASGNKIIGEGGDIVTDGEVTTMTMTLSSFISPTSPAESNLTLKAGHVINREQNNEEITINAIERSSLFDVDNSNIDTEHHNATEMTSDKIIQLIVNRLTDDQNELISSFPPDFDISFSPLSFSFVLVNQLEIIRSEFEMKEADRSLKHTLSTTAGAAIIATLSVGFVTWLIQSGFLMASAMTTALLWRSIDPIPILAAGKHSRDSESESSNEDERDHKKNKQVQCGRGDN